MKWLILAGRGFGKSRTGAEWVRQRVDAGAQRITIVGRTSADVRDVMVEGESGILATAPPWNRPRYEPSKRRLTWPGGAQATTYSADEPDQMRGPQGDTAWADELAAWQYPDSWDQLLLGLRSERSGLKPRVCVTTTPRSTALVRSLLKDPSCAITRGSTFENQANMAASFFDEVRRKYEGTRLGRQELYAEVLDDVEGALWSHAQVEALRVQAAPDLMRIVVAIDPSVADPTSRTRSEAERLDEVGIVVVGLGTDGHGYVLEDFSGQMSPLQWAKRSIEALRKWRGDRIIAETNNGGALVEATLRSVWQSVPYRAVHASRGKQTRAEPIASLYEQGRVHHVGVHSKLEDQMCFPAGTLVLTSEGDVPIERVRAGQVAWTRKGWRRISWAGPTGYRPVSRLTASNGVSLEATDNHPVWVEDIGFTPLAEVQSGHRIRVCRSPSRTHSLNSAECATSVTRETGISSLLGREGDDFFTEMSGLRRMGLSPLGGTSTTSITTGATMGSPIWSPSALATTSKLTAAPESHFGRASSEAWREGWSGQRPSLDPSYVRTAACDTNQPASALASVLRVAARSSTTPQVVYDLTVEGEHEFFANGVLVHNCTWQPSMGEKSPDRMDALVWGLTEIMPLGQAVQRNLSHLPPG